MSAVFMAENARYIFKTERNMSSNELKFLEPLWVGTLGSHLSEPVGTIEVSDD